MRILDGTFEYGKFMPEVSLPAAQAKLRWGRNLKLHENPNTSNQAQSNGDRERERENYAEKGGLVLLLGTPNWPHPGPITYHQLLDQKN